MGRKVIPQKRLGRRERGKLGAALQRIKSFKIFFEDKNLRETEFNKKLISHLRQFDLVFENINITPVKFAGETFRPECLIRGTGKYPLCAVECKKLTEESAKSRWKEGLSQSLLYADVYKASILVLFDYSKGAKYEKSFGRGNRIESRFVKKLRENENVYIVAIRPQHLTQ